MKTALKRILSFVCILCIAFIGVFVMPTVTANAETAQYVKVTETPTDWSGDYLIVYEAGSVAFNGGLSTLDAVSNTISVEITDGAIEATDTTNAAKFTIEKSGSNYTIKSVSGYYIGQTSNANGLKSHKTTTYANTLSINGDGSVNMVSGGAYLRYNAASDQLRFRYYKSSSYSGQKAICLYKYETSGSSDAPAVNENITTALNNVNAYMSLSYQYTETKSTVVSTGATDVLDRAKTGAKETTYIDWSDKTISSNAVYAGQSAGGNNSIQLRATNPSGIVTTASGGKATKITVAWDSNTATGRILDIYGKNSAYTEASDLYNNNTKGTKIGSIVCGTSTELEIEGDYTYIGLRSNSGAMYLTSIEIQWNGGEGSDATTETTETVLKDSKFLIRCAVDASLLDIEGVESVGIRVTAGEKTKEYVEGATSWTEKGDKVYVVINLPEMFEDISRFDVKFTVTAYAVVNENTYYSTASKTYSVADMVELYYNNVDTQDKVEHLYNYLFN